MKKSPFSTPRGNGGWQGSGWSSGGSSGRGYGRPKSFDLYSPNRSQTTPSPGGGVDFIPFDNTPPPIQRKSNDNWQSPRGHWQGSGRAARRQSAGAGYHNHHNHRENRSWDNHQPAPYFKDTGRQFHRQRKNFQSGNTRRKPDISQYMNLRSFMEDPWAALSEKFGHNVSTEESMNNTSSNLNSSDAIFDVVVLDDSIDESFTNDNDAKMKQVRTLNFGESDNSFNETSQELVDTSVLSDCSTDLKLTQDSND